MIVPVILAGGIGARLWPLSRQDLPKQFAKLVTTQTLFQDTLTRVSSLPNIAAPIIICNQIHVELVLQQLDELRITEAHLILEPIGRNTAPAIAIAAMLALHLFASPKLLVLPADHAIADTKSLCEAIFEAKQYAAAEYLVCFGIKPTRPETNYGYIKIGRHLEGDYDGNGFLVDKFVEKPNQELAAQYLQSHQYYWNSGIFMFGAKYYLEELQKFAHDIFIVCQKIFEHSQIDTNEDGSSHGSRTVLHLKANEFAVCRSESIDYAIMEHTNKAVVVPLDADWSDIGSWLALWERGAKDVDGNVVIGNAVTKDCAGSYVHATKRKVIAVGVENYIVVETADAVLIVPKERCQEMRSIIEEYSQ